MNEFEPFLTFDVRNAILAHMLEEAPKECCGWITLANGQFEYVRAKNVHSEPEKHFRMAKLDATKISTNDAIVAYVHSHPDGPVRASKRDMEAQARIKKASVIAARDKDTGAIEIFSIGDHLLDAPLEGREFFYSRFDCYEAIRSEAWQREGRLMDPFPRHDNWWNPHEREDLEEADLDMYDKYYETQGYHKFTPDLEDPNSEFHPRVGDLLLMQIGSKVNNHAAVYVGNNLIYHHRIGKRSSYTPIGYCLSQGYVRKWIRHEGSKQPIEVSETKEEVVQ